MNRTSRPAPLARTALVLGGGGSTGNAWLIGVIAGLREAGVNVSGADVVIGTSAGSTAAAQLASASPMKLLADIRAAATTLWPATVAPIGGSGKNGSVGDHLERSRQIIASSKDAADMRRRFGAAAIELASVHDNSERWRATVATRFATEQWPPQRMLITAVNARTGDPIVFDRHSGVDLVDAVAASCSSGSAYRIGDARYIDGGYRTNADNADLAAGYARVLVLSPLGGRTLTPLSWGLDLATQVRALRAGGSSVETIVPDSSAEHLFGANAMDLSKRLPAAEAGRAQGEQLAEVVADLWR